MFFNQLSEERFTNLAKFAIDQEYAKISILIKLQKLSLLTDTLMLIFITVADQYIYIHTYIYIYIYIYIYMIFPFSKNTFKDIKKVICLHTYITDIILILFLIFQWHSYTTMLQKKILIAAFLSCILSLFTLFHGY